jgi:flagellar hook protein FlgE
MTALSSIAMSGMNAAQTRMAVAGHNIANVQTPGFRAQQVLQRTQAGGGVATAVTHAGQPGVSLANELVGQMSAGYVFKANLRSLEVEQAMLGTLLDVEA